MDRPRYPPPHLPPAEFYSNPPPLVPYPGVPFQRPPLLPDSGWRGGGFRPSMPYRHPHYRHQQSAPHYGSRKRQGDFSNSYGSRRGQYSGRGRNQKYQRFDRNAEKRSGSGWSGENRSGPNAYDPFYDQSMFEDPWKHLLPQAKEEELPNTTEHSTSDLNSPIISVMSMKPEDPEDGSLMKPEVCELDKDGSSVKPEDCELDKDGSSVKPEVCELDKDGSLVKPEHTELGSEYRNE